MLKIKSIKTENSFNIEILYTYIYNNIHVIFHLIKDFRIEIVNVAKPTVLQRNLAFFVYRRFTKSLVSQKFFM